MAIFLNELIRCNALAEPLTDHTITYSENEHLNEIQKVEEKS